MNAIGHAPPSSRDESSEYLITLRDKGLRDAPVELVPLHRLVVAYTPRTAGEDQEYARTLAESETELPPILVHRATMAVVDGLHRLGAARLRGHDHIAARFFDGDEEDALLLAVAINVAQGRPLSPQDRVAAAERIFLSHPRWSDRAVAAVAGLSAKKVAQIRRRPGVPAVASAHRIGRDGRARPLSSAHGRELASELIRDNPDASLRQIAKRAGISPATVADVRDRLSRGEDPVPSRQRLLTTDEPPVSARTPPVRALPRPPAQYLPGRARPPRAPLELLTIFDSLRRDPSLRLNEAGRNILRMLDACAVVVRDRPRIVATVPPHCKEPMSQLAEGYAEIWRLVADDLRR